MRYQEREWSCGPAALANACRALGLRASEGRLRKLAGTTEDGTDERSLITAARAIKLSATEHRGADRDAAWAFVRSNVSDGRPTLLCIDQWQHWVCVIGIVGNRVIYIDSSNTKKNAKENGVHIATRQQLFSRWRCRNEQDEPFYALAIGK